MMINKPTRLGSILVAVLLVLMPAQTLLASVAILNVQPGPGGKPIVRSVTKETVTGDRFETSQSEIQQVLLSDGTSLTLGPGSTMVIESFTYDPQMQSGQLNVRLERGQFRIVGGLLNNTGNIAVQTPSGKLDLDNASVFVEVQANGATRASLLHGKSFKMTTNGHSETVERPAFEVVSTDANQPPKSPSNQDPKTVAADALALNSQSLLGEEGGGGVGDPGGQGSLVLASLNATGSETPFVSSSPTVNQGGGSGGTGGGGGGSEGGGGTFPGRGITGTLNISGGFGPGRETGAPNISGEQPSQFNGDKRSLAQVLDNAEVDGNGAYKGEATRDKGRTTNRLFNSRDSFTQVLLGTEKPMAIGDNEDFATPKFETADKNLQYVFFNDNSDNGGSGLSLAIDRAGIDLTGSHILDERDAISRDFVVTAPFLLLGIELPQRNEIFKKDIETIVDPNFENFNAMGSIFKEATHFEILQAGFSHLGAGLVKREEDNFLLVEVRPGQVNQRLRDILKQTFVINNGEVNDRNGFVQAVDPFSNLTLTDAQIDLLAAIILKPNLKPGTPLTEADLVGAESFLDQFQRSEIITTVNAITLMSLDPTRTERFLFATGDVDGRLKPTFKKEFSVDRFFISAGLENFIQKDQGKTVADGIRAFLRKETGLGLNLADTGLLVVNPGPGSSATQSTLLHADFALQETLNGQQSTISVTIGNVVYQIKTCDTCDTKKSVEAVVEGRTIGSSHGTIERINQDGTKVVVNEATAGFSSPIRSTAAGGGNPALKNPDGTIREGYAGYFVLENYDPPDPLTGNTENGETPLVGGTENPLGGSTNDQSYAYLRLATATGSSKPTLRNELTLNGWMGGIAEFENGTDIGLTQLDSGDTPSNVEIQTSPTNNTVAANFTLFGQNDQPITFNLGGFNVDGTSAFVDDNRFGARSTNNGSEVAMVTADLFRDANGNLPPSLNRPDGTSIPQYEHLKWGFFFGDTKTTPGQREHVHLGTWIAGKIPTGDSLGLRGTATYTGHSIGNVFNNNRLYTAVGSFQNQWDFDKRAGTVQMNFDQTAYTGTTAIKGSSFNFDGSLSAPGRTGGLQGSFVAPVNPTPSAVMGRFAIAETQGAPTYRAAGTFGAERK